MSYDMEAIFKAYAGTVKAIDSVEGCFDANGNKVTIDQTKVDAARIELDKLKYQTDRTINGSITYAPTGEQLGLLYDDIIAGKLDATGSFAAHNKAVKDANPKP